MAFVPDLTVSSDEICTLHVAIQWFTHAAFGTTCGGEKFPMELTPEEKKILRQAHDIVQKRHKS